MTACNMEIKLIAKAKKLHLWEIAEKLNILDSNFSRKLRHELPQAEKERIFSIIEEIAKEKAVD